MYSLSLLVSKPLHLNSSNNLSLFGDKLGGIFFDEGWNTCGENNQYADLYRFISDTVKRRHPGAYTVINPGDWMPQCFEHRSVLHDGALRNES